MGVEVHLLYVSNFFNNYLILKMIFVTILLWMKAAQGLYVNKDDSNDDLQSFSILQNFNSTLRDDKGRDLPLMTLMSEPDDKSDKPMKKRKFKKMILKKRIMRQKAKEQAFANMLVDLNLDKMNMAERFKVMETLAEDEPETENLDYEVAEMHSEANDQASPEHDDSVADHEGKASGSPDMDDDSDSESDSSDSDSDSDSEESDHELKAADEEESGENDPDDSDGDSSDSSSDSDSDSSDSDGPDYYNGDEYEYS